MPVLEREAGSVSRQVGAPRGTWSLGEEGGSPRRAARRVVSKRHVIRQRD